MANYNPEPIEFAVMDYNPNQYNFGVAKSDGIYMGRKLMKDEVLRLIKAAYPQPTKAITIIIDLIEGVPVDTNSSFSDSWLWFCRSGRRSSTANCYVGNRSVD